MVIATQNPIEQSGTYRLPEAQLDRFLIKTSLGYPDHESVVAILTDAAQRDRTAGLRPIVTSAQVVELAKVAANVYVNPAIADYVSRIASATRTDPQTTLGVSVRGCLALIRSAKVWAAAQGRNYVIPDDIQDLVSVVFCHRLVLDVEAEFDDVTPANVIDRIMTEIPAPTDQPN